MPRIWPGVIPASIALIVISALAVLVAEQPGGTVFAGHDEIACNEGVPAGWSCVPLENKPQSGPGQTGNDRGEVLYKFVDADTLRLAVRDLAGAAVPQGDAQFCLDDDGNPYSTPGSGGNQPHDCTGAAKGAVNVSDGTSGIPDAAPAEPDSGAQYEVRVTGISADGTADGLGYAEFNNVDGYLFFVYHINIGDASTQAFFQFQAQPGPTPTPTTPPGTTPTIPPGTTPTTVAGETQAPTQLPATGGAGGGSGGAWLLALVAAAALLGAGAFAALRARRPKGE